MLTEHEAFFSLDTFVWLGHALFNPFFNHSAIWIARFLFIKSKYCIENVYLHGIFGGGEYTVIDGERTVGNTAMSTVFYVECVYFRAHDFTLSICWSWQIYKFIMLSILFAILIRIGMLKKKSTSQFTLQRGSWAVRLWRWVLYSGTCR